MLLLFLNRKNRFRFQTNKTKQNKPKIYYSNVKSIDRLNRKLFDCRSLNCSIITKFELLKKREREELIRREEEGNEKEKEKRRRKAFFYRAI